MFHKRHFIIEKAFSIFSVSTSCLCKGCASTAHRKDEAPDIPYIDISPFLLHSPPQLCLILWAIWPVINRSLELWPQVLNQIHVRRFRWSGAKNRNVLCCQPASGCMCAMTGSIVMLKCHRSVVAIQERHQTWLKCFSHISPCRFISIESYQSRLPSALIAAQIMMLRFGPY